MPLRATVLSERFAGALYTLWPEGRRDPQARLAWKLDLTKSLYRRGYDRSQVIALYRFLDWVMTLADALARAYVDAIDATRSLPLVFRYFPDSQCLGLPGSDQAPCKSCDPSEILFRFCLRYAHLRLSCELHDSLPVDGVPFT